MAAAAASGAVLVTGARPGSDAQRPSTSTGSASGSSPGSEEADGQALAEQHPTCRARDCRRRRRGERYRGRRDHREGDGRAPGRARQQRGDQRERATGGSRGRRLRRQSRSTSSGRSPRPARCCRCFARPGPNRLHVLDRRTYAINFSAPAAPLSTRSRRSVTRCARSFAHGRGCLDRRAGVDRNADLGEGEAGANASREQFSEAVEGSMAKPWTGSRSWPWTRESVGSRREGRRGGGDALTAKRPRTRDLIGVEARIRRP